MKRHVEIFYTRVAEKEIENLPVAMARRIIQKIEEYSEHENFLAFAKPLTGEWKGAYRYRVGDYRILFTVGSDGTVTILTVLSVKHRKDVYR